MCHSRFGVTAVGLLVLVACNGTPPADTASPFAVSTPSPTTTPAAIAPAPAATPRPATLSVPAGVAMPNSRLTPGAIFIGVTEAEVCTSGWATSHCNVTPEQYVAVYGEYGIGYPEPSGTYELDHLIPLELGGDNVNANLWPERASPAQGFHQKDALENTLHDLVCAGSLNLAAAQLAIASNWYAAYVKYAGA
jgi:hypothetical protein